MKKYFAIDLFSGCGGLSQGLRTAGFEVAAAFDNDKDSVATYKLNHPDTKVFEGDIRDVNTADVKKILNGSPLHLLAGCPPCQGFSSMRRLNKKRSKRDNRNNLVLEYLRFVKELKPLTIMMENVPGLVNYTQFKYVVRELDKLGYNPKFKPVSIQQYGVPQRRKRLVVVGSLLGDIDIAPATGEKVTVRDMIGHLESVAKTKDPVHKIVASHTQAVMERIKATPKNGGSRNDLPKKFELECHKGKDVGFNDVYGRLRWDDYSTTITGGCLNPSKGRFLHPKENRAITAREAALLQTFPPEYKFPEDASKTSIALQIGNALPPKFSYVQSANIMNHLQAAGI
ncbi:DNA cytosine methyltransferase [Patescibacteria group bacterium]|nr:DNA cytosine methyltransferase [Patescibacteria group bacterium]MDL1953146.1 DNA cytosine methyltransferase [Candidatus Uhrbacteria bacterium UHB]RIL00398.1 MAG: DNA (cytosine-5-)-methyltransferase [Candidatus Uhrbacteria bacterium]